MNQITCGLLIATLLAATARADVVTDWNIAAGDIVNAAELPTPAANRVFAIVHTASYAAANAITRRYPAVMRLAAPRTASVDAAIAAAHCATLRQLVPAQKAAIDRACAHALADIAAGAAKDAGVAVGEQAAATVLAARADDGADTPESYRPHTTPGAYVPTALPVASQWPQRRPWLMTGAAQFRPGPPPPLTSERWARDYNEIKAVGARHSATRSAEQTAIARFWETHRPTIYHGLIRSVAGMAGRDVTQNARLFAAAAQATDDALLAVFDGKYHYGFWRPITAIRNGDQDGNDATARDASWQPLITTPMHPEYPCAHCIVAAAVGAVLQAEIGKDASPKLTTASPTADGAVRSWSSVSAFVQEVSDARVYDGVHYRYSTEIGADMGRRIGALAVARFGLSE
jgi:hypothetical protein